MNCPALKKVVACANHPFFIWDHAIIPYLIRYTFTIQSSTISDALHSKLTTYSPEDLKSKLSFFSTLSLVHPSIKNVITTWFNYAVRHNIRTSPRLFQDPFTSQNPLKFLMFSHTLSRLNRSGLVKIYLDSPQFYCVLLSFNQSQVLLKLPSNLNDRLHYKEAGIKLIQHDSTNSKTYKTYTQFCTKLDSIRLSENAQRFSQFVDRPSSFDKLGLIVIDRMLNSDASVDSIHNVIACLHYKDSKVKAYYFLYQHRNDPKDYIQCCKLLSERFSQEVKTNSLNERSFKYDIIQKLSRKHVQSTETLNALKLACDSLLSLKSHKDQVKSFLKATLKNCDNLIQKYTQKDPTET